MGAGLFDPAHWHEWLRAGAEELDSAAFWVAIGQILFVDILLSGDNAVVIAMACRGLPQRQRLWGLVAGTAVAVILRVAFAGIVSQLMLLSYLKLIGGAALLFVAAKLIVPDDEDPDEIAAASHLWRAIFLVAMADAVMSLDNVIALAAIANGNMLLLVVGLALSIPPIIAGAALIMAVLDRVPLLIWAGAALLGWVAGAVMASDPAVVRAVAGHFGPELVDRIHFAAGATGAMLAIALGGLWRRLHVIQAAQAPAAA